MTRFKYINHLITPEYVLNPFLADTQNIHQTTQKNLLKVKHYEKVKIDFKHNGYELIWFIRKKIYP